MRFISHTDPLAEELEGIEADESGIQEAIKEVIHDLGVKDAARYLDIPLTVLSRMANNTDGKRFPAEKLPGLLKLDASNRLIYLLCDIAGVERGAPIRTKRPE